MKTEKLKSPSAKQIEELFPGRGAVKRRDAAAVLGISSAQISNLIDAGEIHAINIGTGERKNWRIPVIALVLYAEKKSNA